jgi:hypothetical protein
MIYGNAELMGIPWELIIKTYRKSLGHDTHLTVAKYAEDFLRFLEIQDGFFPPAHQAAYVNAAVRSTFEQIKQGIDKSVQNVLETEGTISDEGVQEIAGSAIRRFHQHLRSVPPLPNLPENYAREVFKEHGLSIPAVRREVFQKLPMSRTAVNQLGGIARDLFERAWFPFGSAGIVIAGFGDGEIFPSLVSYDIEAVISRRVKCAKREDITIAHGMPAAIVPFAQSEMVQAFMDGIDPRYGGEISAYLSKLFQDYPGAIASSIPGLSETERAQLIATLKSLGVALLGDFQAQMLKYSHYVHVSPVMDSVGLLPKDELAAMAEALVNLTSFKRKVTLDAETVGGPIDVAVISRGDGFIWINRKHYFNPALNPHFLSNYYRGS